MTVKLDHIGKRYNREWIFREVDLCFVANEPTAIVGANGSGKSTLLQCISGFLTPSEGHIQLSSGSGKIITAEEHYRHVSIAAPYLHQDEWLTFREAVKIQSQFKPFRSGFSEEDVIERSGLQKSADKYLNQFSSGMKQRVRLVLAILADSDVLLLDEPLSNLDQSGAQWFSEMLEAERTDRTVIICSNRHPDELALTSRQIDLSQFKPNG